jgi:thiol-disulfide isomerase/thioredoxin
MEGSMKRYLLLLCAVILASCASPSTTGQTEETIPASLPDLGPAPELKGDVWLNTVGPLRPADLRGKVVLVDMWTFECINCQHILPSVRGWYEKYGSQGLTVIGNHYPEFEYESQLDNLKKAIVDQNIPFVVVQDNAGTNWQAFNSRAWPSLYLIDKTGHIRYIHIGEGAYAETEAAIQTLLNEPAQQS